MESLSNLFKEWRWMTRTFRRGGYPAFVSDNVPVNRIPVFIFHRVRSISFERQLRFLKMNHYDTILPCDFEKYFMARDKKAVLLTFDDGIDNLYQVAFPLLKKYDFTAAAFIIPEWIGHPGMLTWAHIQEMHRSNLIDIESHSLTHSLIPSSSKIIDFIGPKHEAPYPWSLPITNGTTKGHSPSLWWGTPIYESASGLSDKNRHWPNPLLAQSCLQIVAHSGGKKFFRNPFWRSQLHRSVEALHRTGMTVGKYEDNEDRLNRIRGELLYSKQILEHHLQNTDVRYFAYPWNQTGEDCKRMLPEYGYHLAFSGLTDSSTYDERHSNRLNIPRINSDFIFRLPGEGRKPLSRVILLKIIRRLVQGASY